MAEEELLVSIYLDADVERMIAKALRRRGYTCHAADEVGMKQASDEAQIEYAARVGYALVTYNVEHFAPLPLDTYRKDGSILALCLSPRGGEPAKCCVARSSCWTQSQPMRCATM